MFITHFFAVRPANTVSQTLAQSTPKKVKISGPANATQTPVVGTASSILVDQHNGKKNTSRCAFKNLINVQQNLSHRFEGQCIFLHHFFHVCTGKKHSNCTFNIIY